MKIGVMGCGSIGRTVIKSIYEKNLDYTVEGVFDVSREGFEKLPLDLKNKIKFYSDFDEFIRKPFNIVLESASQKAVKDCAKKILANNKNLMIMSVGALEDDVFFGWLKKEACKRNLKIYIPSGAAAGIDGLKSAGAGEIESVELVTRKNPESLGLDVRKETVVFDGSARDAVRKFPKNINVSATLSLAGIGFDRTRVKIIADPGVLSNTHEIRIKGNFGEISTTSKNQPFPENPKTSYLAALSAIATLKKISENIEIGT